MIKKEYNIAIALILEGELLVEYQKFLNSLNSLGINFIKQTQCSAHITISIGTIPVQRLSELVNKVEYSCNVTNPFILKSKGLGVFFNKNLNFHIRWVQNLDLLKFKTLIEKTLKSIWKENIEYNCKFNWLPKTSLAYKDIKLSDFQRIDCESFNFENKKMLIKKISIIKFELGKKEKIIKKIILNGAI